MSTVDQLLRAGARQLGGLGGSPRLDGELLLAHALGQRREDLYRSLFSDVPAEAESRYSDLLAQRVARCPVAQLVGYREFWSFRLNVTGATLVPRPETEVLVERALDRIPVDTAWRVADLGTGSGAIALAIARERRNCKVTATDLSKPALTVARRNASALDVKSVTFKLGNWCDALPEPATAKQLFNLLVSNPPYIAGEEWAQADPELAFEPRMALDGGEDGLDAYRAITSQASRYLHPGGWLLFEHGSGQARNVGALMREAGFHSIATTTDLAGRARVTEGRHGTPP